MSEIKTPKFVEDFANYLVAIRNLSQVYIKNMTVTIEQFLEFINVHKFKNKYNTIEDITLNEIRSLNNSDIYSFIFFLAESHYQNNSRVIKIEHLIIFMNLFFYCILLSATILIFFTTSTRTRIISTYFILCSFRSFLSLITTFISPNILILVSFKILSNFCLK